MNVKLFANNNQCVIVVWFVVFIFTRINMCEQHMINIDFHIKHSGHIK